MKNCEYNKGSVDDYKISENCKRNCNKCHAQNHNHTEYGWVDAKEKSELHGCDSTETTNEYSSKQKVEFHSGCVRISDPFDNDIQSSVRTS